jgi:DNA-binding GntR family transcriptional regulator
VGGFNPHAQDLHSGPVRSILCRQQYAEGAEMASAIYDEIRADILSGHFKPGEPLGENAMAARYGTSRTPIREALLRLELEQLLERGARGMQVRTTSPEEILDIYEVRTTLEGAAARTAARRRTELDLLRLKSAHQAMVDLVGPDDRTRADSNRVFHEMVWSASHSPTLFDLLERLNTHLIRYPTTTLAYEDRWATVLEEHSALVAAIEAQDADEAGRIAEHHMSGARDVRLRMYGASA